MASTRKLVLTKEEFQVMDRFLGVGKGQGFSVGELRIIQPIINQMKDFSEMTEAEKEKDGCVIAMKESEWSFLKEEFEKSQGWLGNFAKIVLDLIEKIKELPLITEKKEEKDV